MPPASRNTAQGNVHNLVQVGNVMGDVLFHAYTDSASHAPQQLPAVPSGFVDREAVLAELDAVLLATDREPRKIAVVSGLAGVGKTAMVRLWARQSSHRYPGGQLYVDYAAIRTESGTPVSDALAECLCALGVARAHIPPTLSARTNLFRMKTASAPVLVVLDDVTEPAQVPPFVPSANGSSVIATSTARLTELALDGAYFLRVEPLTETCGTALLQKICGDQRIPPDCDGARRLVQVSAGLPVALRVIGARLASSAAMTATALADELTDESTRLARLSLRGVPTVSDVFDNAYRSLSPDAALLYRLLGASPVRTCSLDTAAAILDLSPDLARHLVDVLREASLLDEAPGGGFVFHDLVRLHARERSQPAERLTVLRRLTDYYLSKTAFADEAIMGKRTRIADHRTILAGRRSPFATDRSALGWLADERSNLLALLRAVSEAGWHDQTWQLAEALMALYLNRRYLNDWIESAEIGATAARRAGNEPAEARLRSVVSRAYTEIGAHDRARASLDTALALAERSGNKVLTASVWEFIGRFRDQVDPESSPEAYEQAIHRNQEAGERRGVAIATYFLGCAMSSRGDQTNALRTLKQAHRLLLEVNDQRMAGRGAISLGLAFLRDGNTTAARERLLDAVEYFSGSEATYYEAQAREALADVAVESGDPALAREQLERVLLIRQASGAPDAAAVAARLRELPA
ncbi:NB-ARC domain-containing protein [Lentzea terrae]|uniref:NB-ARC domain-containing protein n=1 Tax=Lentzea terrae TaxID=2200761 RepID=UPI0018E54223|nr:NB-ARC domain-containing protein [Lentzea terrae]